MTTHELLELASLDALGLLDDDERADFERGFQAASPALQAQIRREQTRLARAEALLPDVEPAASLRARVLAAVREAIQTVGVRKGGRLVPTLLPSRGVSPIWRAAAIGSMAAAIIFGFATLRIRSEVTTINKLISANATEAEWVREYGARFSDMLDHPETRYVQFARAGGASGRALIMVDTEGTGHFSTRDLAENVTYALVPVLEDGSLGTPVTYLEAPPAGTKHMERIQNFELATAHAAQLALIPQSRTGLALSDAVLLTKGS
jgi:hypothetical protein